MDLPLPVGKMATNLGMRAAFVETDDSESSGSSEDNTGDDDSSATPQNHKKKRLKFDWLQSRFELRTTPLPVTFLGTKDHAVLRNVPQHKIFLNLSETEVLCTTTAEALAMGKFVILPKHRK